MAGPMYGYSSQGVDVGKRPTSGLAIAGFITALIPFTALIGLLLSFIAIFLTGARSQRKGRGLAISGTIIGVVWCLAISWGLYSLFTFGTTFLNTFQRGYMYGMEIRAEKYHEEFGEYPKSLNDFWSNDLANLGIDDETRREMDIQGKEFEQFMNLVRYEAPKGPGEKPRLFAAGLDSLVGTSDDVVHEWGVNPMPELKEKMMDHPFVPDELATEMVNIFEDYFARLREMPLVPSLTEEDAGIAEEPASAGTE